VARALRRADLRLRPPVAALGLLVGLSALIHWLASRRFSGVWIMPDEAIYAQRALDLYHKGSLPLLHGQGAGYGVLYPVVAGPPLLIGSFTTGDAWLKPLQAIVISLAAVPVYSACRRLMPGVYALVAAGLTLASPLLLYSGFVMTEVLFYPLSALALLAIARAAATASLRDQALAFGAIALTVLTRTQGIVFVGVFALAVLVDAAFARDRSRLRAFWPVWTVFVLGLAATAAHPGLLGAYSSTIHGGYPLGRGLGLTFDHLAYIAAAVGVIPAAALVVLFVEAARGKERDPEARALIAVAASAVVLVAVQVGFFAARFAPHLLGRDLAALPPVLDCMFALCLSRRASMRLATAALASFAVLALLLLVPWNTLTSVEALPDTFDLSLLERLSIQPANAIAIVAPVLLALFVLVPRRALVVLPVAVLALLTAGSIVASNRISGLVRRDQVSLVGPTPNWIDRAVHGEDVTYLYDGEPSNIPWQELFWNHRLTTVLSALPYVFPGPSPRGPVPLLASGRLPIATPYVVATDLHQFVGTPVAHLVQTNVPASGGLTLWRLKEPATLSMYTFGVSPNGDMEGVANLDVYDCGGGQLRLTLIPKKTSRLRVLLDGTVVVDRHIGGPSVAEDVDVPPSPEPRHCRFTIVPQSLLGSTQIAFARPGS
jgi:hypothetical protein